MVEVTTNADELAREVLQGAVDQTLTRFVDVVQTSGASVLVGVRSVSGQHLVNYAAYNEFGTRSAPERSFLRSTAYRNQGKYADLLQQAAERHLDGIGDQRDDMARIGELAKGDVQRTIVELREPPNAPSTIAAKGSANPLIDSGRLLQSIDYEVEVTPDAKGRQVAGVGLERAGAGAGIGLGLGAAGGLRGAVLGTGIGAVAGAASTLKGD